MNVDKLKELYSKGDGTFYTVMNSLGILFIESPEDQGLPDGVPQETVLRVFTRSDEALAYREIVLASQGGGTFKVVGIDLTTLWSLIPSVDRQSMKQCDCPLRVEVCFIDEDGWPQTIDLLHSVFILWN